MVTICYDKTESNQTKPKQNGSVKVKTMITSWEKRQNHDNEYSVFMWACSPLTDESNEEVFREKLSMTLQLEAIKYFCIFFFNENSYRYATLKYSWALARKKDAKCR